MPLDPAVTPTEQFGNMTYEELIASGTDLNNWEKPTDEWDAIALNYTSGTTGIPKGVVVSPSWCDFKCRL